MLNLFTGICARVQQCINDGVQWRDTDEAASCASVACIVRVAWDVCVLHGGAADEDQGHLWWGEFICVGVSSFVLGWVHMWWGEFICGKLSSFVLGWVHLCWGEFISGGMSSFVVWWVHLWRGDFICGGVSSFVVGWVYLWWGEFICGGVNSFVVWWVQLWRGEFICGGVSSFVVGWVMVVKLDTVARVSRFPLKNNRASRQVLQDKITE